MYNDVDMVWLGDPFPYLKGNHDVYFTDDMAAVRALTLIFVNVFLVKYEFILFLEHGSEQ